MVNYFRSEEVVLCQLYLEPSHAYNIVKKLGDLAIVEFRDLNKHLIPQYKKYTPQIKDLDGLDTLLTNIYKELKKNKIQIAKCEPSAADSASREDYNRFAHLKKCSKDMKDVSSRVDGIREALTKILEMKQVLKKVLKTFATGGNLLHQSFSSPDITPETGQSGETIIHIIGGVIIKRKLHSLETVVLRICRGNYIIYSYDYVEDEDESSEAEDRSVIIVFCHGSRIAARIDQLAKAFGATVTRIPNEKKKTMAIFRECDEKIKDLKKVLAATEVTYKAFLEEAAANYCSWITDVSKKKAIYDTLNKLNNDAGKNLMAAQCWVPVNSIEQLHNVVTTDTKSGGLNAIVLTTPPPNEKPPTYFRQNKVTQGFQNLIDAYGMPAYQEMNPMPFTIVTFPFLFGIMFGDMGHGMIMLLFAIYMVTNEKKLIAKNIDNDIFVMIFGGRYIILFMSIASIYAGLMYNDLFGIGVAIFPSQWVVNANSSDLREEFIMLEPKRDFNGPPPVGLDVAWTVESFAFSAVPGSADVGVVVGIQGASSLILYFKEHLDIIMEWVPKLLFLSGLFGYLVILIVMKWFLYGPNLGDEQSSACAPNVLISFINMMLGKDNTALKGCDPYMYSNQKFIEKALVVVALICVPWMLLVKPLHELKHMRKEKKEKLEAAEDSKGKHKVEDSADKEDDSEEEGFGDMFINQCIHTIEYVLGAVSYTASYLRLWALSLAHSQLSDVLWKMVFLRGFLRIGPAPFAEPVVLYLVFGAWAVLTVSILVLMEGLSAFLHTLRLHWMEFQSKFYAGTGRLLEPFNFNEINKLSRSFK